VFRKAKGGVGSLGGYTGRSSEEDREETGPRGALVLEPTGGGRLGVAGPPQTRGCRRGEDVDALVRLPQERGGPGSGGAGAALFSLHHHRLGSHYKESSLPLTMSLPALRKKQVKSRGGGRI